MTTTAPTLPYSAPKKPRLLSLDAFRGATVAAMILVNNPGSWGAQYWPLAHAHWHGCTPTDWIMPFFLFIVGVSIVYALDGRVEAGQPRGSLLLKGCSRAAVLFLLGLTLAYYPGSPAALATRLTEPLAPLATLRIMGVLQRIAVVYLACVCLFVFLKPKTLIYVAGAILVLYWATLTFVPVPSAAPVPPAATTLPTATRPATAPAPAATAGGWIPANLDKDNNLGAWVDRHLLTTNHLYGKNNYDPEGPFSTVAAVSTGILGMLAGVLLKRGTLTPGGTPAPVTARVAWLFGLGVLLAATGWGLGYFHPLNKALWTSTYALYTAGLAAAFLAGSYFLIDLVRLPGWLKAVLVTPLVTPFVAFGVNAITAFWVSGLMGRTFGMLQVPFNDATVGVNIFIYRTHIVPRFADPKAASLAYALLFLSLWTAIVLVMYRKKWIIKV